MSSQFVGSQFYVRGVDRSDGSVRFCDEREPQRNAEMIMAALAPLPLIEVHLGTPRRVDHQISDLHHRIAPVGGPPSTMPPEVS